jgi:hypothetical protein
MQVIQGAVGANAANAASDVALVQALLMRIAVAGATKPLLTRYDGDCGAKTEQAIADFQTHFVFVSASKHQSVANPGATAGQIKPGDASWTALLREQPAQAAELRVLPGGKIVYEAASDGELQARIAAVGGMGFTTEFRQKVLTCIRRMHALHGIAVGVCREGDRRDFQQQYAILMKGDGSTHAGPGERNHNFGMAADLGFAGLRWLHPEGMAEQVVAATTHTGHAVAGVLARR